MQNLSKKHVARQKKKRRNKLLKSSGWLRGNTKAVRRRLKKLSGIAKAQTGFGVEEITRPVRVPPHGPTPSVPKPQPPRTPPVVN